MTGVPGRHAKLLPALERILVRLAFRHFDGLALRYERVVNPPQVNAARETESAPQTGKPFRLLTPTWTARIKRVADEGLRDQGLDRPPQLLCQGLDPLVVVGGVGHGRPSESNQRASHWACNQMPSGRPGHS